MNSNQELVNLLIIERFGSKENFGSKIICLWNQFETTWQLCLNYRDKLIPLMPELPSYPNKASDICLTAGKSLANTGCTCVGHLMSSLIKGYKSHGFEVHNPQSLDKAVTIQLGLILHGLSYVQYKVMIEEERYGYEDSLIVLECDYIK